MNAVVNTLSDLIKIFTDTFRLPALFPALIFVLLNRTFIFRYFESLPVFSWITNQSFWDQALPLGLLTLVLGYTINAFEVPIIRLYEGYQWGGTWLGRFLKAWQNERRIWLDQRLTALNQDLLDEYRKLSPGQETSKTRWLDAQIKTYEAEIMDDFPPDPTGLLPTKLGNVISAFEAYPDRRYGMDGVTFWPRMMPILDKEGYLRYVNEARSTVDFLLNTSLLMIIFGFECIVLRILFVQHVNWILPLVAVGAAWIFYQSAIRSTYIWAAFFQTGFDLFRYHLAAALGLRVAPSFEKERAQWSRLTEFWNAQSENIHFRDFNHTKQSWPVQEQKQEG